MNSAFEYVKYFLEKTNGDISAFNKFSDEIKKVCNYSEDLNKISDIYKETKDNNNATDLCEALAKKSDTHIFTVMAITFIISSKWMRDEYLKKGCPENIFWDTVGDYNIKIKECIGLHGIWGIFTYNWYNIFFEARIFTLGRLQYEIKTFEGKTSYKLGDYTLNPQDDVCYVHIPSSGPLTKESRISSYRQAYEFFKKDNKPLFLSCHSWLLYEDNKKFIPPHLNLADFISDWQIVENYPNPEFPDCWRLFGRDYNNDPKLLPRDNTLRRAFAEWLDLGNIVGSGLGIMAVDKENIIK